MIILIGFQGCDDDEENQANKFATELLLDNCDNSLLNKKIYCHEYLTVLNINSVTQH